MAMNAVRANVNVRTTSALCAVTVGGDAGSCFVTRLTGVGGGGEADTQSKGGNAMKLNGTLS